MIPRRTPVNRAGKPQFVLALKNHYDRILARKGRKAAPNIAKVAVARKLAEIIYRILKEEEGFKPPEPCSSTVFKTVGKIALFVKRMSCYRGAGDGSLLQHIVILNHI